MRGPAKGRGCEVGQGVEIGGGEEVEIEVVIAMVRGLVLMVEGISARGLRGEVVVGKVEVGDLHRVEVGPRAVEVGLKGGRVEAAGVAEGVGNGQASGVGGGREGKVKGKVGGEGGIELIPGCLKVVVVVLGVEKKKTRVRLEWKLVAGVARRRRRPGQTRLLSSWRRPFLQAVDGLNEEAWERRGGRSKGPVVPVTWGDVMSRESASGVVAGGELVLCLRCGPPLWWSWTAEVVSVSSQREQA